MASCIKCSRELPLNRKTLCSRCEREEKRALANPEQSLQPKAEDPSSEPIVPPVVINLTTANNIEGQEAPAEVSTAVEETKPKKGGTGSCIRCGRLLPLNRKTLCSRCEREAKIALVNSGRSSQPHAVDPAPEAPVFPTAPNPPKPVGGQVRIKVFHCPECNSPLVPGDTSCLKCGKRFDKPIPRVAADRPKPATAPTAYEKANFQIPIAESNSSSPSVPISNSMPKSSDEGGAKTGKIVIAVLLIGLISGGISAVVNTSHSNSGVSSSTYPPPNASQPDQPSLSQSTQPADLPPLSQPEPPVPQPQIDTSIDSRLIGKWRDEKGDSAYVFNSDGTGEFAAVDAMNEGQQQLVNVNVRFTIPHWTAENGQLRFNRVWCEKEYDEATNEMNTKLDSGVADNYNVGADGSSFTITDSSGYSITYDKTDF